MISFVLDVYLTKYVFCTTMLEISCSDYARIHISNYFADAMLTIETVDSTDWTWTRCVACCNLPSTLLPIPFGGCDFSGLKP